MDDKEPDWIMTWNGSRETTSIKAASKETRRYGRSTAQSFAANFGKVMSKNGSSIMPKDNVWATAESKAAATPENSAYEAQWIINQDKEDGKRTYGIEITDVTPEDHEYTSGDTVTVSFKVTRDIPR